MFFVIAWMGGKYQRRCRKRIEWLTRKGAPAYAAVEGPA